MLYPPADRPTCIDNPELFQHALLEEPPAAKGNVEAQRQARLLEARAALLCESCPLFTSCLYDAVVNHDVAGFVAGTTEAQRTAIRTRLGVSVETEDLDALAGVVRPNRQINHEEVLRLRAANPHESLEVIAMRLGCSLSTVKRHMRKSRTTASKTVLAAVKPSVERVLQVFAEITQPRRRERRVA